MTGKVMSTDVVKVNSEKMAQEREVKSLAHGTDAMIIGADISKVDIGGGNGEIDTIESVIVPPAGNTRALKRERNSPRMHR
jgi:uncharacterized surface protein with fasciclin (FAS1) repeats